MDTKAIETSRRPIPGNARPPAGVRQVYLIFFDAPAIVQFRRKLGVDADALSPIMFIAGAGTDFASWLPQRIHAETDCLAPVEIVP